MSQEASIAASEKVDLTAMERDIAALKQKCEDQSLELQSSVDALDEAVRVYMDYWGGSPTRLAAQLGISRGRVYQYRNRGREKHKNEGISKIAEAGDEPPKKARKVKRRARAS